MMSPLSQHFDGVYLYRHSSEGLSDETDLETHGLIMQPSPGSQSSWAARILKDMLTGSCLTLESPFERCMEGY